MRASSYSQRACSNLISLMSFKLSTHKAGSLKQKFMSNHQTEHFYETVKETHDEECDCLACIERMIENQHEWDYDNASDNELTHG